MTLGKTFFDIAEHVYSIEEMDHEAQAAVIKDLITRVVTVEVIAVHS